MLLDQLPETVSIAGTHIKLDAARLRDGILDASDVQDLIRSGLVPIRMLGGSDLSIQPEAIRLALTPTDVHTTEELGNYLAGYKNAEMMADNLSPIVPVPNTKFIYRTFSKNDTYEAVAVKAGLQDRVPEIGVKSTTATAEVRIRFIGAFIDDVTAQNATAYRTVKFAAKRCSRVIALDREIDVVALLTTLGSWASTHRQTLIAGTQWDPSGTGDPISDLMTAVKTSFAPGMHTIWMNWDVLYKFIQHPKVIAHFDKFRGTELGGFSAAQIKQNMAQMSTDSVAEFMVPMIGMVRTVPAKYIAIGATTAGYILGDDVVLTYTPPGLPTDGESIATSKSFRFFGNGPGFESRMFRVEDRGPKGGQMLVCAEASIEVMTANDIGYLFKDVLA